MCPERFDEGIFFNERQRIKKRAIQQVQSTIQNRYFSQPGEMERSDCQNLFCTWSIQSNLRPYEKPFVLFYFPCNLEPRNGPNDLPDRIKEKMTYPVLDFAPWVGVVPISNPAMPYGPSLTYKIAIDVYGSLTDSNEIPEPLPKLPEPTIFSLPTASRRKKSRLQRSFMVDFPKLWSTMRLTERNMASTIRPFWPFRS